MDRTTPQDERPRRGEDVVDRILNDIRHGVFSPGAWLKQIDLEERYGCKRPVIREALARLSEKRLIGHIPNRGYFIHRPDGRRTGEILEIRLLLEIGIAGKVVAKATPANVRALRELAGRFEQLIEDGTVVDLYEANLAFHRRLLEIAGNSELIRTIEELRQQTSSAPVSQWMSPGRTLRSAQEHFDMVNAIARADSDGLVAAIRTHIRQSESAS